MSPQRWVDLPLFSLLPPPPSHIPRLLPAFQHCRRKTRARTAGKSYHTSDVVGGTDLQVVPRQVGSTCYVIHMISFTRLPCLSRAMLKICEEPGYELRLSSSSSFSPRTPSLPFSRPFFLSGSLLPFLLPSLSLSLPATHSLAPPQRTRLD